MNHNMNEFMRILEKDGYAETKCFKVEKLAEKIYHMDEGTSIHPAGCLMNPDDPSSMNNPSSIYFVKGEHELLVIDGGNIPEAGSDKEECARMILEAMAQDRTVSFALTHGHGDHIGLLMNREIVKNLKIGTIYIGKGDDCDEPEAFIFGKETCRPWHDRTIAVSDGDCFKAADCEFEVCGITGHTPGSIAFLCREKQIVFTGDAVGSGYVWLFWQNGNNPLAKMEHGIRSLLNKTEGMTDLRLLAGHRWQQFKQINPEHPDEMHRGYLVDMLEVLEGIRTGESVWYPYSQREGGIEILRKGRKAKIDTSPELMEEYRN